MKNSITDTFLKLWLTQEYGDITVKMICSDVPISRTAFYRHFNNKEDIVFHFVSRDFVENCLPIFRFHLREQGVQCFFSYIREHRDIYMKIYAVDDGILLFRCLKAAYKIGFERRQEYSRNVVRRDTTFNPNVFFEYACSGIAAVVSTWIKDGMVTPDNIIARDLYIMMSEKLGVVRDYFT